jgi:AGZA family xanthine/uracil permease-like MFS transporter
VFFVLMLFDTIGTLLGVCERAGLLVDGRVPRAGGALAADAVGTVVGTALGTSTVTSYVESAAGVAVGGRTGLTAVVTGVCLLLALVFTPLSKVIGAGVAVEGAAGVQLYYPVIAPVLILIGALMIGALKRIDWDDPALAIPAFLTVVVMQLSISITEGIAWGFIATSALAIARGRARATLWVVHVFAALFVLRYVFL